MTTTPDAQYRAGGDSGRRAIGLYGGKLMTPRERPGGRQKLFGNGRKN
jgi:hypothetical protein